MRRALQRDTCFPRRHLAPQTLCVACEMHDAATGLSGHAALPRSLPPRREACHVGACERRYSVAHAPVTQVAERVADERHIASALMAQLAKALA